MPPAANDLLEQALSAMPQQVAVIDAEGIIRLVNRAWVRFACDNGLQNAAEEMFVGSNYLTVLLKAEGEDAETAQRAYQGICEVLDANAPDFSLEYPCHAPDQPRWFVLQVTPTSSGGAVLVHTQITERKRAELALADLNCELEDRVRERTRQVRELAEELTLSEAKEQARLARVLHDGLQQQLYAVQFALRGVSRVAGDPAQVRSKLDEVESLLKEAFQISRTTTANLSPPILEGEGLVEALKWLSSDMQNRYGLEVTVRTSGKPEIPNKSVRMLLFSLARELLFNVVKHAGVNEATVALRQDEAGLEMVVSDRGKGFDLALLNEEYKGTGLGLSGVHKRLKLLYGHLRVDSGEGKGTRVIAGLPAASLS